jgi:hypothetical protein
MYRQGLGDCFLLSFPSAGRESHMLVDCGVLEATADTTARMTQVAESIFETTGGRLDALVVTHQHWDHVSGFVQAKDVFDQFEVGEVWLAWTEDPADDLARELSLRREKTIAAVSRATFELTRVPDPNARRSLMRWKHLLEFHGNLGAVGRAATAKAMEWVAGRKGARVRYFKPGDPPAQVPGVDSARAYALGPPRDRKLLRKSDPSARAKEVYGLSSLVGEDMGFLAAVEALDGKGDAGAQPFDRWFRISQAEAWDWPGDFFGNHYGFEDDDGQAWRRINTDWLGVTSRLALQLDSHTNNTSLALAFELIPSGRVLLFPGDAQVGNWLSWFGREWRIKDGADTRTVTAEDLLARTVLYKVGHHGSHNATLREQGLDLMTSRELVAMLPVDRATAKKMDWNMPFAKLLRRLHEKTGGRVLDLETGVPPAPPARTSDREWEWFLSRTEVHGDWVDYRVEP